MNELEKAAREVVDLFNDAKRGTGLWGPLCDAMLALEKALPQEYRCRDCASKLKPENMFVSPHSNGSHQWRVYCESCEQSGMWCDSKEDALKAAAGMKDERT